MKYLYAVNMGPQSIPTLGVWTYIGSVLPRNLPIKIAGIKATASIGAGYPVYLITRRFTAKFTSTSWGLYTGSAPMPLSADAPTASFAWSYLPSGATVVLGSGGPIEGYQLGLNVGTTEYESALNPSGLIGKANDPGSIDIWGLSVNYNNITVTPTVYVIEGNGQDLK